MDRDVVVVGGGIAGLTAALALVDAGRDVELLEADDAPGGLARSERVGDRAFARGPQSFLGSAPTLAWLIERTRCEDQLVQASAAKRRLVYRHEQVRVVPSSPLGLLTTPMLSLRGRARLLAEPFVRNEPAGDDESVTSFFARRFGREATDELVVPFCSGVHAGNADALEARSAFGQAWSWERGSGSIIRGALQGRRKSKRRGVWSHRAGIQGLADAAASQLGARVSKQERVETLERDGDAWRVHARSGARHARHVVLALPPPAAASVLRRGSASAAQACDAVPMAPVAVVHLGGPVSGARPEGFGVLMHRDEGLETLGIVLTSSLFPHLAPDGEWLQSAYVGGRLHPHALDRGDDELCALARDASRRVLGFDPDAGVRRVVRHAAGIPQLEIGHAQRIASLRRECARLGGLSLAGAWLDGIGLEAAAASGRRAAAEVVEAA